MWFSAGLKSDGTIVAWGDDSYGECDVPGPDVGFVAVSAGSYHCLGLKVDGSIVAWGDDTYGQCDVPAPNSGFIGVAGGGQFSLGLKSDGSVVGWGRDTFHQCDPPAPNADFIAVAGGDTHSIGLKRDGSVVCWGSDYDHKCDVPPPDSGFVFIAAGVESSFGLKNARLGACCHPNGACTITIVSWCTFPNQWQGPGSVCAPIPCSAASVEIARLTTPRLTLFPNPSRGVVSITVQSPNAVPYTAGIFDAAGREVRRLETASQAPSGSLTLTWNGRDDAGRMLPPGMYLARITSATGTRTGTIVRVE